MYTFRFHFNSDSSLVAAIVMIYHSNSLIDWIKHTYSLSCVVKVSILESNFISILQMAECPFICATCLLSCMSSCYMVFKYVHLNKANFLAMWTMTLNFKLDSLNNNFLRE